MSDDYSIYAVIGMLNIITVIAVLCELAVKVTNQVHSDNYLDCNYLHHKCCYNSQDC